ncbi:Armadillo-type fold [Cynara cardunculus var. scolymus]|uniref:Armadillo-type fold n=1 Tax=Cynara cardunculus var. scolymus TaxID=59895 RepID=A0A103XJ12_CYNCS|nr:Armadillo-type fold [Cynara cardunculus var. scolymus]
MASTDVELEQQLKEAGKQLSHPPDSVDELLPVLDQVEKLLSKVDQSPKKSMLDALKPSMKALIQDGLSRHSDVDVKVAVASCISEITRITAPDAPYTDDQMRVHHTQQLLLHVLYFLPSYSKTLLHAQDVFQLIVSSFEHLADRSSRSYEKRASILETVSKVRSCVIMLDLECDGLIVEMFEHFLKSVRDYHLDSVYSSMENIMVLVFEESEEISVEMLKPVLASVKKQSEGVLPVARRLGEGVLLKSAAKLRPYLMPALISLGDTVDNYSQVVASVCEGTTATFEHNDENASGPQLADESKLTTASSDHTDQVVKEGTSPEEVDPTLDRSPKSVMSNGVNVMGNDEASVDQESSKKPEEEINEQHLNLTSKEDTDDSDAEKLAKVESKPEQTAKKRGKKVDTVINSAEPSDSSHVEGEKETEKLPESQRSGSKDVRSSPVKESSVEAVVPSEIEKDSDVQVSSPKAIESKSANVSSPSQSGSLPDESCVKKTVRSKKKQVPEQDEIETANAASPSKSGSPPDERRLKKGGRSKNKGSTQEETPTVDAASIKAPEVTSDSDIKPQRRAGKKAVVAKEVKLPATIDESEDGEATSDSDAKPLRKSSKKLDTVNSGSKSTKQLGKKGDAGDSEAKKPKQSGKKMDAGESDSKKPKQTGKKVDATEAEGKTSKQSLKKADESDSDTKPLKHSVKKGEKSGVEAKHNKVTVEDEEESDSETKPLKLPAKKGNTSNSGDVKSSSKKKDDGRKRGSGKNVTEKDPAKSLCIDDEMNSSPKTAAKSTKGEGNVKDTPVNSSKRKRSTGKDKISDAIKYDKSLVGLKVKVWWPEDKMYYEGLIESYDSGKKKHKVSYVDGDQEILNLKTQKWEILQEFSVRDEEQATEAQSAEASPETHKKKKSKTDPAPSASQEKNKDSAKRVGEASSSGKTKGTASKDHKSKDMSAAKSTSQKTSGKSTDAAASKESGKSKEDEETPKASSKTKQETSKTVNKSKGKTPQSGGKSNTNGPSKAKSGQSNVKESEKANDSVKTPESTKGKLAESTKGGGSKSGKKRKKRS